MSLRDRTLDDIVFTAISGESFTIKTMREYPSYQMFTQYNMKDNEQLDEIASRTEIYGDEGEMLYYKIVEFNKEILFDAKFDLSRIKTINIPVP